MTQKTRILAGRLDSKYLFIFLQSTKHYLLAWVGVGISFGSVGRDGLRDLPPRNKRQKEVLNGCLCQIIREGAET